MAKLSISKRTPTPKRRTPTAPPRTQTAPAKTATTKSSASKSEVLETLFATQKKLLEAETALDAQLVEHAALHDEIESARAETTRHESAFYESQVEIRILEGARDAARARLLEARSEVLQLTKILASMQAARAEAERQLAETSVKLSKTEAELSKRVTETDALLERKVAETKDQLTKQAADVEKVLAKKLQDTEQALTKKAGDAEKALTAKLSKTEQEASARIAQLEAELGSARKVADKVEGLERTASRQEQQLAAQAREMTEMSRMLVETEARANGNQQAFSHAASWMPPMISAFLSHPSGEPFNDDEYAEYAARLVASGAFDPEFYYQTNPDVADSGADPALHYLRYGMAEGRHPRDLSAPLPSGAPEAGSDDGDAD